MEYIDEQLVEEIRGRYDYILSQDTSSVALGIDKLERKAIERMAQVHSFRMEHPHLKVPYNVPKNGNRREIKKGIVNLRKAFKWGNTHFDRENFNESFVREIAGRVLPEIYGGQIADYRERGTSIKGASTTPPYPEKLIYKEIPNFETVMGERLKSHKIDSVETAIYAHFHIARMHPFVDGNGRTSRLVQDIILHDSDFPVPIIEVGERNTYYNLLGKAVYDWGIQKNWKNEDLVTEGERAFYTFMAGKINVSLDKIICTLSH